MKSCVNNARQGKNFTNRTIYKVSVKIRGSRVFADERTFVPAKIGKLFLRRGV